MLFASGDEISWANPLKIWFYQWLVGGFNPSEKY